MNIADWVTYFTTGTNWVIPVLVLWLAPWKLIALYRAARRGQWLTFLLFVVITPVNDFGIVEMFYIFSWSRSPRISNQQLANRAAPVEPRYGAKPTPFARGLGESKDAPPVRVADYGGPIREAPEMKELAQTGGVGKIDIAALSELERMRKLAKERGETLLRQDSGGQGKPLTPPVPSERKTVRPDIPIPRPPKNQEPKTKLNRSEIQSRAEGEPSFNPPISNVDVLSAPSVVAIASDMAQPLMPGVFIPKRTA